MKYFSIKVFWVVLFFIALSTQGFSQDATKIWQENYDKAIEALSKEQYDSAEQFLEEAYSTGKNNFTKNDPDLYNILYYLGITYKKTRNPKKALMFFEKALENAKYTQNDTLLIKGLKETSNTQLNLGNTKKALNDLKLRQNLIIKTFGVKSLQNSKNLLQLSSLYLKMDDFDMAIDSNKASTSILESIYGPSSILLVPNISQLSQIYGNLGNYDKALKLQDKALSLFDTKEKESEDYVLALFIKAWLLEKINEKKIAIDLYKKVQDILKEQPNHPGYIAANGNIGQASTDLGDYETALTFIQESLKKTSPDNLIRYTTRMQNLAFLYTKLGDFDKAEKIYNKAKNNLESHKKSNPILYSRLINNIGKMYVLKGDLNKSESLFKEALDVFLTVHDKNHIQYGYQLNDYANTLFNLNRHEEALQLFQENIDLSKANNRTNTQEYQNWIFNLGEAYNKLKRFNEALPLIITASDNTKTILGKDHIIYGQMINTLAYTYIGLGNMEDALPQIETSNTIFINEIEKVFRFRSEKEKRDFMMVVKDNFDELLSLSYILELDSYKLNSLNLNNQLLLKGLLLNSSKGILPQLRSLKNDSINAKIQTYNYLRSLLSKTLSQPIINRDYETDSLRDIVNLKEAELVKLNSKYFGNTLNLKKNWKLSKNTLKKDELAIEFANYNLIKQGKSTDSIMYVAYFYKKDWKFPKMISLFEEAELKTLLKGKSPNQIYTDKNIHDIVFQNFKDYLKGIETIFYAPSGILNQLSLPALFSNLNATSTNYDNIDFFQLSSTALLKDKFKEPDWTKALFIGGINYDYIETVSTSLDTIQYALEDNPNLKNTRGTRNRGESWTYLPGSLKEIQNLNEILTSQNKPCSVLNGNKATESYFKSLSENSPKILHLATHGYFYENNAQKTSFTIALSTEDRYRLSEDPLLRSGLILSGANYAWNYGTNPSEPEDGILTALEISNLDLSNTDIIILSACETGLGDINGSEGVYGLQRAFKMAGVDIIVMSLWQVPDFETAEFMELFYKEWISINNVKKAFNNAQKVMRQKYIDEPKKWAAFVLFE